MAAHHRKVENRRRTVPWAAALAAGVLTAAAAAEDYFPESDLETGWRKNTHPAFVHSLGLDPDQVKGMGRYNLSIRNFSVDGYDYAKHKGALVIKDGWIVGEWYDRPDGKTYMTYLSSVGKSVALTCFGIAVKDAREGRIPQPIDRNSKVYDPRWLSVGFPLSDPRKADITFEHIFRHTSGLTPQLTADGVIVEKGRDEWTDYVSWVVGRDPQWPQTRTLYFPPGHPQAYPGRERWGSHEGAYSSVAFAHLGLVFSQLYGRPAHEFLWTRLLQPIGASGVAFHEPPQPPEIRWFTGGGLRLTTRDFARFAYLLMKNGRWKERQLLPPEWVESFTSTPYYPNLRSNVDGYFGKRYPKDLFRMFGSGGNFAFVVPSLDLIAVRTGRTSVQVMKRLQRDFLNRMFLMVEGRDTD